MTLEVYRNMARAGSADGRRVTVSFKASEAVAALIDEAAGDASRSAWVLSVVLDRLGRAEPPAGARRPRIPVKADERVPADAAVIVSGGQDRAIRLPVLRDGSCQHPKARVNKGLCGACGTGGLG